MSDDEESQNRVLSRKELARQLRRQAYQRAKAQRAKDPKYLAMKEVAKQQRREAYQQAKAQRKAAAAEEKRKLKEQKETRRTEERAELDAELMALLRTATKGSSVLN